MVELSLQLINKMLDKMVSRPQRKTTQTQTKTSHTTDLMLSRMEPNKYVESKHARLTRRRLNAFLISLRDMMTEAIELPTIPKTARVVCKEMQFYGLFHVDVVASNGSG